MNTLQHRLKQMLEESSDICKEYDIPKPLTSPEKIVLTDGQMDAMDETGEINEIQ